jgi:hypothetical protein
MDLAAAVGNESPILRPRSAGSTIGTPKAIIVYRFTLSWREIVGPMLLAPVVSPTALCFPLSDSSSAALLRTYGVAEVWIDPG